MSHNLVSLKELSSFARNVEENRHVTASSLQSSLDNQSQSSSQEISSVTKRQVQYSLPTQPSTSALWSSVREGSSHQLNISNSDYDNVQDLEITANKHFNVKPLAAYCKLTTPQNDQDVHHTSLIKHDELTESITIKVPHSFSQQGPDHVKETWTFPFTRVFDNDNFAVFKDVGLPSVSALFANKSTTIMNHGGSGAGKSYTLFGSLLENSAESLGLIPRCLKSIFSNLSEDQEVHFSYLEVHGEGVSDLLSIEVTTKGEEKPVLLNSSLVMSASANQQISIIPGLSQLKVDNLRDAMVKLARGSSFRTIRKTKSNKVSTRGHGIFSIHLISRELQTHSKLVFVDLAAFDRDLHRSSLYFKESVTINKSLFFLERVLNSITSRKTHIPYRNCLFTSVLRFCLQYCPRIQMIANLSLNPADVHDSLNTCLFFKRVRLVKGQRFQGEADPILEKTVVNQAVNQSVNQSNPHPIEELRSDSTNSQPILVTEHQIPYVMLSDPVFRKELSLATGLELEYDSNNDSSSNRNRHIEVGQIESKHDSDSSTESGDYGQPNVVEGDDFGIDDGELPFDNQHLEQNILQITIPDENSVSDNHNLKDEDEEVLPFLPKNQFENRDGRLKKLRGICFYTALFALLGFIFIILQPPSISSVVGPLLCPPSYLVESGVVQLSSQIPEWRLHQKGEEKTFEYEVYFTKTFSYSPQVFVSFSSIHTSPEIGFDVSVTTVAADHFTVRLIVFDNSLLESITLSWIAISTLCFEDPSLFAFSSSINGDDQLGSSDLGFGTQLPRQFTLPMSYEFVDDVEVFFSFRGVRFHYDDTITESNSIETNYEVAHHPQYNGLVSVETWLTTMREFTQVRYALLAFNSSFLKFNAFDRGSLSFGLNLTNDWELHLKGHHVFSGRIFFNNEFQRIPEVFVYITGIDTNAFPFAVTVEASHVDFLGFNLDIASHDGSICRFLSIEYFAFDVDWDRFDILDFLLISISILFLILALLFEKFKGFFKGSINTSKEKYHSLPDNWFELIQDEETLAARQHYQPEPPARVFRNDTWIELLESFERLKRQYSPGARDTVEIVFWMFFALILFLLLFFFYRDFMVATRFLHSVNRFYITLFILGLEHFLIILAFFTVSWPEHRVVKGFNDDNSNVAILIASHISAGRDPDLILNNCKNNFIKPPSREELVELKKQKAIDFERTLRLASRSVGNGNVYVCHNANRPTPFPNDGTIEVIKKVKAWGRTVNYVYIPTGNKTFCLHYVNKNILAYRPEIEYVVIMDDDVMIPADMSWQTHRLAEDDVAGGVITIRTDMNRPQYRNSWRRRSFLVAFQDMEYLLSGLLKLVQEKFGTCAYPHGAISIWKKKELNFVLDHHNSAFHGEDAQMGFILREKSINGRMKRLICLAATPALTQAPEDLFHLGEDLFGDHCVDEKSLFNQRVKSWDACAHRFFFKYLEHLVRYWNVNTIILKPFYIYEIITIIRDYFHFLIILYFVMHDDVNSLFLIYFRVLLLQYIVFFAFNYVKLRRRKDLQSPLVVVLLAPLYRLVLSLFRVFALFYNLFEYLPKKRMPSDEDPNLKVPYFHNYLSLNMQPEMWTKVWSIDEVKKGVDIHLPDDLPPLTSSGLNYRPTPLTPLSPPSPFSPGTEIQSASTRSRAGPIARASLWNFSN
ncbi:hypothetical protein P9112_009699 [Eukaryota sp. TZLM1-RC]